MNLMMGGWVNGEKETFGRPERCFKWARRRRLLEGEPGRQDERRSGIN